MNSDLITTLVGLALGGVVLLANIRDPKALDIAQAILLTALGYFTNKR